MGLENFRKAVYPMFASVMSVGAPTVTVAYDNHKFDQPDAGMWVYFALVPGERRRITLGNQPAFRLEGVLNIACMVKEDEGTGDLFAVVDTIITGMCDKEFATDDGTAYTHSVRTANRGVVEGWFTINAKIEFRYDEQVY